MIIMDVCKLDVFGWLITIRLIKIKKGVINLDYKYI